MVSSKILRRSNPNQTQTKNTTFRSANTRRSSGKGLSFSYTGPTTAVKAPLMIDTTDLRGPQLCVAQSYRLDTKTRAETAVSLTNLRCFSRRPVMVSQFSTSIRFINKPETSHELRSRAK
ncbi:Protein kinase domain-containing protein [Psidium guajava]|nr:Protein kinase domain-containing protein [Psidium guajava]